MSDLSKIRFTASVTLQIGKHPNIRFVPVRLHDKATVPLRDDHGNTIELDATKLREIADALEAFPTRKDLYKIDWVLPRLLKEAFDEQQPRTNTAKAALDE